MSHAARDKRDSRTVRGMMAEWMQVEGHGVRGPLEQEWRAGTPLRAVVDSADTRHTCLYITGPDLPSVAIAVLPKWSERVHPCYREMMFRDIWQQYRRYQARELRGEPIHQPGDKGEDWP